MKKSVIFDNGNLKMAGRLYLPFGFEESKKYPALVFIHPDGGVKEQTAGLYAEKTAGGGYAVNAAPAHRRIKAVARQLYSSLSIFTIFT